MMTSPKRLSPVVKGSYRQELGSIHQSLQCWVSKIEMGATNVQQTAGNRSYRIIISRQAGYTGFSRLQAAPRSQQYFKCCGLSEELIFAAYSSAKLCLFTPTQVDLFTHRRITSQANNFSNGLRLTFSPSSSFRSVCAEEDAFEQTEAASSFCRSFLSLQQPRIARRDRQFIVTAQARLHSSVVPLIYEKDGRGRRRGSRSIFLTTLHPAALLAKRIKKYKEAGNVLFSMLFVSRRQHLDPIN